MLLLSNFIWIFKLCSLFIVLLSFEVGQKGILVFICPLFWFLFRLSALRLNNLLIRI